MKSKKSLTFLAGIALLSLSACDSMGPQISVQEAEGIQGVILSENKKNPTKAYSYTISGQRNEKTKTNASEMTYSFTSKLSFSFDIDKCYARVKASGESNTVNPGKKETSRTDYDYCLFHKDGYLYATVEQFFDEAEGVPALNNKLYAKKETSKDEVKMLLSQFCAAETSIEYGLDMSSDLASTFTDLFDDFKTDSTFYSKGNGNLSSVSTITSKKMKEDGNEGSFELSTTTTIDGYVVTKSSTNYKYSYSNSWKTIDNKVSLTMKAKKSCAVEMPDLTKYSEEDFNPAGLSLMMAAAVGAM